MFWNLLTGTTGLRFLTLLHTIAGLTQEVIDTGYYRHRKVFLH